MISVKVNKADPTDLYEQVAAEIRRAIADGEAKPGERLPAAMDLAAILGVNKNTVLRSLQLLRQEGLLEFRRGRGITVAGTPERGVVVLKARELVELGRNTVTAWTSSSRSSRTSADAKVVWRARLNYSAAGTASRAILSARFPHATRQAFPSDLENLEGNGGVSRAAFDADCTPSVLRPG